MLLEKITKQIKEILKIPIHQPLNPTYFPIVTS